MQFFVAFISNILYTKQDSFPSSTVFEFEIEIHAFSIARVKCVQKLDETYKKIEEIDKIT